MPTKSTTKTITCQNPACGRIFSPETHANRARFCNMACYHKARSILARKTWDRICPNCGKAFQARFGKSKIRFCSPQCWKLSHKGGKHIGTNGYILVYVGYGHHLAIKGKPWAYEHRLVMERKLGRRLEPKEQVHHKNDNKADNCPENLEFVVSSASII